MKRMNEEKIRQIIRDELSLIYRGGKYVFDKNVQFLDGRNIQTGRTTGTTIGTAADQKVGFFGNAVVQQSPISDPVGGTTVDAQCRSAVNAILYTLRQYGLIDT
jgi:hypothetical protein